MDIIIEFNRYVRDLETVTCKATEQELQEFLSLSIEGQREWLTYREDLEVVKVYPDNTYLPHSAKVNYFEEIENNSGRYRVVGKCDEIFSVESEAIKEEQS